MYNILIYYHLFQFRIIKLSKFSLGYDILFFILLPLDFRNVLKSIIGFLKMFLYYNLMYTFLVYVLL